MTEDPWPGKDAEFLGEHVDDREHHDAAGLADEGTASFARSVLPEGIPGHVVVIRNDGEQEILFDVVLQPDPRNGVIDVLLRCGFRVGTVARGARMVFYIERNDRWTGAETRLRPDFDDWDAALDNAEILRSGDPEGDYRLRADLVVE